MCHSSKRYYKLSLMVALLIQLTKMVLTSPGVSSKSLTSAFQISKVTLIFPTKSELEHVENTTE